MSERAERGVEENEKYLYTRATTKLTLNSVSHESEASSSLASTATGIVGGIGSAATDLTTGTIAAIGGGGGAHVGEYEKVFTVPVTIFRNKDVGAIEEVKFSTVNGGSGAESHHSEEIFKRRAYVAPTKVAENFRKASETYYLNYARKAKKRERKLTLKAVAEEKEIVGGSGNYTERQVEDILFERWGGAVSGTRVGTTTNTNIDTHTNANTNTNSSNNTTLEKLSPLIDTLASLIRLRHNIGLFYELNGNLSKGIKFLRMAYDVLTDRLWPICVHFKNSGGGSREDNSGAIQIMSLDLPIQCLGVASLLNSKLVKYALTSTTVTSTSSPTHLAKNDAADAVLNLWRKHSNTYLHHHYKFDRAAFPFASFPEHGYLSWAIKEKLTMARLSSTHLSLVDNSSEDNINRTR